MKTPSNPYDYRMLLMTLGELDQCSQNVRLMAVSHGHETRMLSEIPTMQHALHSLERTIVRMTTDPNVVDKPWTITSASKALGISRQTFYTRYFV